MTATFMLVFTGKLRPGVKQENALKGLVSGLGLSAQRAGSLLKAKGPVVISKGVTAQQGKALGIRLSKIGLVMQLVKEKEPAGVKPAPPPAKPAEPKPEPEPKPTAKPEAKPTAEGAVSGESDITVSLGDYEKRLLALKEQRAAQLAAVIEANDERKREQLQIVVVHVTEALSFSQHNYALEMTCRKQALEALEQIRSELDDASYQKARDSICNAGTAIAEQVFDAIAVKGVPLSALAAYHSGRLAECRMEFLRAKARIDKAVALEPANPDYLRSAGLLARILYNHKKSVAYLTALEKLLAAKGENSLELALARRELAYSIALAGQNKRAGQVYKKAMVSLTKMVGQNDAEMGICWYQIGILQESMGQYETAEALYKKALAIMEKTDNEIALCDILDKLGRLHMELEGELEAVPLFTRLCSIREQSPHPDQAALIIVYNNLAEAYRVTGRYEESEGCFNKALALTQVLRGKDHPAVGSIYQELAKVCERQKKGEQAQEYQQMASAIFQRVMEEQLAREGDSGSLTL